MASWLDYIKYLRMKELYPREDAQKRLEARFGQADAFGTPMMPTAQDLMDYQTASAGVQWPKERLSNDELSRISQDITGGTDIAVNAPSEVIAKPLSAREKMERQAQSEAAASKSKWGSIMDALGQFSQERDVDMSKDDMLANIGIKRAPTSDKETWGESYEGPGGSRLQKSNKGQERAVLGRQPGSGGGEKMPESVKQAQQVVLKFANQVNPQMAMALAINPALASDPNMKAMISSQVPEAYRPLFNNAMAIVQNYYMNQSAVSGGNDPFGIR